MSQSRIAALRCGFLEVTADRKLKVERGSALNLVTLERRGYRPWQKQSINCQQSDRNRAENRLAVHYPSRRGRTCRNEVRAVVVEPQLFVQLAPQQQQIDAGLKELRSDRQIPDKFNVESRFL